jgi:hypothetical protein
LWGCREIDLNGQSLALFEFQFVIDIFNGLTSGKIGIVDVMRLVVDNYQIVYFCYCAVFYPIQCLLMYLFRFWFEPQELLFDGRLSIVTNKNAVDVG